MTVKHCACNTLDRAYTDRHTDRQHYSTTCIRIIWKDSEDITVYYMTVGLGSWTLSIHPIFAYRQCHTVLQMFLIAVQGVIHSRC